MPFPMPRETKHLRPVDEVWYGKAEYKEGLIVPEINIKYGCLYSKAKTMPGYARYLVGLFHELLKTVKSIERNPFTGKSHIGAQELADFESYAYELGVSGIRYTSLEARQPVPAIGTNLNLIVLARDAGFGVREMRRRICRIRRRNLHRRRCRERLRSFILVSMKLRFDMIGLFVRDLSVMVAFYRDVVGLDIDWNGEGPYAEFNHEGIRFAMYERKELPRLLGVEPSFPEGINGTFELAVNVGERGQVDRTYSQMTEAGARPVYPPRDEPWKMRSAMVTDPEGNLIEIASDFWE